MPDIEERLVRLERWAASGGVPLYPIGPKYHDSGVDYLLGKHGCKTLADMDALVVELKAKIESLEQEKQRA